MTPVLTRIFKPEAFGLAAVFASITALFVVVACGRYDLSIPLPEKDSEGANQFGASVLCALLLATITGVVTGLCGRDLLNALNLPELVPYRYLIPASILVGGLHNSLTYWNTRTKQFSLLSIAQVSHSLCANGSKLLGAVWGFVGAGMLIIGQFIGLARVPEGSTH